MVIEESTPAGAKGSSVAIGGAQHGAAAARREPSGGLMRQLWLLAVRRRYLINKRRQLRTAAILLAVTVIFLVLMNITLYFGRAQETGMLIAAAPELEQVLGRYDRNELILSLLGSVVILGGVFVVTIIETHRTAGAEFNLARQLTRVADGKYRTELRLRRGDNLRDLQDPFNRMTRALRERADEDIAALERLAALLEGGGDPGSRSAVAAELRELAHAKSSALADD